MIDYDPIAIILVSSGSRGDRLLFRYPQEVSHSGDIIHKDYKKNPYSIRITEDLKNVTAEHKDGFINNKQFEGILPSILTVKPQLCGHKFHLMVDDVQFIGHPLLLHRHVDTSNKKEVPSMTSFNVLFVLKANVNNSVIDCYHDLSKQLSIALRHEERRCGYLTEQQQLMIEIYEDTSSLPEDEYKSPYNVMSEKCQLAQDLSKIIDDLKNSGVVKLYVNRWVQVSFCLPHKVHNVIQFRSQIQPDDIQRCLQALRPYHGILMLEDEKTLLDSLLFDSSPALVRLVKLASPLKSLQQLAADTDLALPQVFLITSHLVYWAKALVIYPLCDSNVYVLSPDADVTVNSQLSEQFVQEFPAVSLQVVMAEFSLPSSLSEHKDVLELQKEQNEQIKIVVWMLKHRLLLQLHTYIFFVPTPHKVVFVGEKKRGSRGLELPLGHSSSDDMLMSDTASVTSDESLQSTSLSTFNTSKTPSIDMHNNIVLSDEVRAQRNMQESLLNALDREQRESIAAIPAASNPDDLKLFARLLPYFNGQHHLEEVMYYENCMRSQLLTLLDKFRPVLVTCRHQDPATAFHVTT